MKWSPLFKLPLIYRLRFQGNKHDLNSLIMKSLTHSNNLYLKKIKRSIGQK